VDLGVLAELEAAGLVTLASKGYQGSTYAKIPYKGRTSPSPRKRPMAPTRNSGHLASERANAQLKIWHILRKLRCCPWRAGQLAKAIHVLQIREAADGAARTAGAGNGMGFYPGLMSWMMER
jgi:hypothetical protein